MLREAYRAHRLRLAGFPFRQALQAGAMDRGRLLAVALL